MLLLCVVSVCESITRSLIVGIARQVAVGDVRHSRDRSGHTHGGPPLAKFIEVSCLYALYAGKQPLTYDPRKNNHHVNLVADEREATEARNYWKACKRHYSLLVASNRNKPARELLEALFDSKWGALSVIISDLNTLALLGASSEHIANRDASKLAIELDGIQMRIGRLAIEGVGDLEGRLQAGLRSILDALERRNCNPSKLNRASEKLAEMLDEVLQEQAKSVYGHL